jgi:thiosulfate dehydrogenase
MKRPSPWLIVTGLVILIFLTGIFIAYPEEKVLTYNAATNQWKAPDTNLIDHTAEGDLIRYGRELIANTAKYFGPKGTIAQISNGLNCQNCHVHAGTIPFGNPFSAVTSTYPKYRDRSGQMESVVFRINECMERSLNGQKLDSNSREVKAMIAYFNWLGKDVPKGAKPIGSGSEELSFLDRAADTANGRVVYITKCRLCHGANGEGLLAADSASYTYPPLWGPHSYNVSAGMYRLTRFAGFVKNNMPFGTTHNAPQLTNEQAWDVAAYVNSKPRPEKMFAYDWPKLSAKPVDYPFGPYTDTFSEAQHKYGPFAPIKSGKSQ